MGLKGGFHGSAHVSGRSRMTQILRVFQQVLPTLMSTVEFSVDPCNLLYG